MNGKQLFEKAMGAAAEVQALTTEELATVGQYVGHRNDCDNLQPMWHKGPCDCGWELTETEYAEVMEKARLEIEKEKQVRLASKSLLEADLAREFPDAELDSEYPEGER